MKISRSVSCSTRGSSRLFGEVARMHAGAFSTARKPTGVSAIALGLLLTLHAAADAASCQQSKLTAAGKRTAGELKCHTTAVRIGMSVSAACLGKVGLKFQSTFAKADTKGTCPTPGDHGVVAAAVDACVSSILSALGAGSPPSPPAACLQAKMKAARKKASSKLRCWTKAAEASRPADPACLTKAETKFGVAFAKAEQRAGCAQTGDAGTVESAVDSCISNVVALLPSSPTTTTTTTLPSCGASEPGSDAGITRARHA